MGLKKEAVDQTLHAVVTALILLPVAFASPPWLTGITGFLLCVYREDAQHRPHEGWRWMVSGSGRWLDVAFGTLGAVLVGFL